jgi:hypothetical protein
MRFIISYTQGPCVPLFSEGTKRSWLDLSLISYGPSVETNRWAGAVMAVSHTLRGLEMRENSPQPARKDWYSSHKPKKIVRARTTAIKYFRIILVSLVTLASTVIRYLAEDLRVILALVRDFHF